MLSRELVKKHMMRLIDAYGTPDHIQSADDLARWIDFYHKELSRNFNDRNLRLRHGILHGNICVGVRCAEVGRGKEWSRACCAC